MRRRRLLGFFPHPDDESLAAGGTLALCASLGAEVHVLSATRGEAGPNCVGAADLAAQRSRELAAACAALGAEPPRFLDLADGGAARWDRGAAARALQEEVRRLQPDAVLALGPDGAYGHVDHVACAELLAAACAALAGPQPRLLWCAFPRGLWAPLYRRLRRRRPAPLVDLDPSQLGTDAAAVDLRVDVSAFSAQRRAAIEAHRSQLPRGDLAAALTPEVAPALLDRREEWFVHAGGAPLPPGAAHPLAE